MKTRPSGFSSAAGAFLIGKCLHVFCLFVAADFLHANALSLLSFTFAMMIGSALLFMTIQRAWGVLLQLNRRQLGRMITNGALLAGSLLGYAFGLKHCGPIRTILMDFCNHLLLLLPALMFGWSNLSPSRRKGLCFVLVAVVLMMMSTETSVHDQSVAQSVAAVVDAQSAGRFHVASIAAPEALPEVDEYGMPRKVSAQVPASMLASARPVLTQDPHTFTFLFITLSEGTAGMLALIMSSTLAFLCKNYEKRHAKEFGGRKRFHAVSMTMGGILLIPFILLQTFFPSVLHSPDSHSINVSWILLTLCILVLFMVVLQFYVDQIAQRSDMQLLTKLNLILSFLCAVAIDAWRGEERLSMFTIAAAISILGGVHYLLNSPATESTPLPLSAPAVINPAMSVHSSGMMREARLMLKHFTSDRTSLRIFSFLCLNLSFMFVELLYGYWSNSLGLISDAGHMLFDCTALGIGLYASYVSRMKSNSVYTYGYARYEILSGYVNAVFLLFIAYFIFVESVERLFTPVVIQGENLVFVSAFGLCVNLVGLFFFHDHSHGGGGGGHGHSHGGGHGHSHGGADSCDSEQAAPHTNHNLMGIYLHILADTLGSCGVICSSLLIKFYNFTMADSICSIIISVLIVGSTGPLLRSTLHILLNRVPEAKEEAFLSCLSTISSLPGVREVSAPHLWLFSDAELVCTLHLLLEASADEQDVLAKAADVLKGKRLGVNHLTLQCEKDKFHATKLQPTQITTT